MWNRGVPSNSFLPPSPLFGGGEGGGRDRARRRPAPPEVFGVVLPPPEGGGWEMRCKALRAFDGFLLSANHASMNKRNPTGAPYDRLCAGAVHHSRPGAIRGL